MTDSQQHYLLIINGKSAGNPALREAVDEQRRAGMLITVRATWEGATLLTLLSTLMRWALPM